ncbi:hypothetical protein J4434_06075 [Candidatus Woesearchaeota archaeon]|nr:hypothetical protein [Candidatus Woesearchaeota archaeon]
MEEMNREKGVDNKSMDKNEEYSIDLKKVFNVKNVYSKVKEAFSGKKSVNDRKEDHDDDKDERNKGISTIEFIKKNKTFFLILIPVILSIFLRLQPAFMPVADDWGRNNVENYYKNQIGQQINQQYPNLPEANRNALIEDEFKRFLAQNEDTINQQAEMSAQQLRAQFQDETGQVYLHEIDPWSWYRDARNYIEHGYTGDVEVNGRYYDNHRLAPLLEEDIGGGDTLKINYLHGAIEIYLYKFINLFSEVPLRTVAFYIPVIIYTLGIIPAYFLVRKIAGDLGGVMAGIFLAINPFALSRTAAGFSDTDSYNILFPLLIFLFLILAIEYEDIKKRIVFCALCGLSMGLYAYAWGGWMFIVNFSIFLILGIIAFRIIKMIFHKKFVFKDIRGLIIVLILFLIFGGIGTSLFNKFHEFKDAPKALVMFLELKDVAVKDIWPNVFTTVAELNPGDVGTIFQTVGGKLLVFFTLLGIMLSFYVNKNIETEDLFILSGSVFWFALMIYFRDSFSSVAIYVFMLSVPIIIKFIFVIWWEEIMRKRKDDKYEEYVEYNILYPLLFSIYLFGTMFSVSRGVRFSLLLVPAYAICLGTFTGIIVKKLTNLLSKTINLNKTLSYVILIVFIAILLLKPISAANQIVRNEIPLINDQWYEALTKIKEDSNKTAIVNSWWDFGHWFKAIADRGVTLDGGGQDKPQAHWLGKLMLAKTEEESKGVLRLLVCGKNYPYDRLNKIFGDGLKAKTLLDEIILVDKEKAREMLEKNNVSEEDIIYLLSRTHCEPPQDYFITSEDMVSKSGVWGHFGSWDFKKSSMYSKVQDKNKEDGIKILKEEFNLSDEDAKKYYSEIKTTPADQWVSTWPGYVRGKPIGCTKVKINGTEIKNKIECPVPISNQVAKLEINLKDKEAFIGGNLGKNNEKFYLNELYLPTKEGFEMITGKDENTKIGISGTLIPTQNGNYEIVLSHPLHAGSIFTILFYGEGHGLKHFKKFYDVTDVTGARIIVWKIDWEGKEANEPYKAAFENPEENINEDGVGSQ